MAKGNFGRTKLKSRKTQPLLQGNYLLKTKTNILE